MSQTKENKSAEISKQRKRSEYFEKVVRDKQRDLFGPRFEGATLGNLLNLPSDAQQAVQKWMNGKKYFLIYCGAAGIGKTHLCSALMEWIIPNFNSYRFWEERDILKRLRSSMNEMKGDYLETLKGMVDDEIVIINDVGSQGVNEWREEIFFDIVDVRYNTMQPTIITSNFSVKDFKDSYHSRVWSRLFSVENTIIEILDGEDLRTKGF